MSKSTKSFASPSLPLPDAYQAQAALRALGALITAQAHDVDDGDLLEALVGADLLDAAEALDAGKPARLASLRLEADLLERDGVEVRGLGYADGIAALVRLVAAALEAAA